ncbi:MAG: O-antigen/teichoic acid export membrane protein [Colwellia sp.]|jgi:O-antigen/teichoic acid export membrane protein
MLIKFFNTPFLNKFGIYFIGKGLIGLVNFALIPVYAKTLVPEEFAKVALLMIFIPLVTAVLKLGQEAAFSIKFYKFSHEERSRALYSIMLNYIATGSILALLIIYQREFISDLLAIDMNYEMALKISGILFFCAVTEFFFNLLKMEQEAFAYIINSVSFTILRTTLLIYFIVFADGGFESYIDASILSYTVFFFISILSIIKKYSVLGYYFDKKQFKNLLLIGIPVVPGMIFSNILNTGDQYMLKEHGLLVSVGIYAIAYKFAGFYSSFIIEPFKYALVPIAMKKGNENIIEFKKFMKIILESFIVVLLLLTLFLYTFFDLIFYKIIDAQYHAGFEVIIVVMVSLIIWGGASIVSNVIVLKEQTKKTMYLTGFAATLNIALNLMLIPYFDFMGAAYATLITYVIVSACYLFLAQSLVSVKYDLRKLGLQFILFLLIMVIYHFINEIFHLSLLSAFIKLMVFMFVLYVFYRIKWLSPVFLLKGI